MQKQHQLTNCDPHTHICQLLCIAVQQCQHSLRGFIPQHQLSVVWEPMLRCTPKRALLHVRCALQIKSSHVGPPAGRPSVLHPTPVVMYTRAWLSLTSQPLQAAVAVHMVSPGTMCQSHRKKKWVCTARSAYSLTISLLQISSLKTCMPSLLRHACPICRPYTART